MMLCHFSRRKQHFSKIMHIISFGAFSGEKAEAFGESQKKLLIISKSRPAFLPVSFLSGYRLTKIFIYYSFNSNGKG
jgi:hypothetical protein